MEQNEFLARVQSLIEYADTKGNLLTEQEMLEPFAGEKLDGTQIEAIKTFLSSKGVMVSGMKGTKTSLENSGKKSAGKNKKMTAVTSSGVGNLNAQEKRIYESYLEEVSLISGYAEDEEAALFARKAAGDYEARNILTEGNLHTIVEIAAEYAGKGVSVSDLIQEGNMALIMLIDESDGSNFHADLRDRVGSAMELLIMETTGNSSFKDRVAMLANKLLEIQEELEKEREEGNDVNITVEDLAARLRVTPEEIETVMKMSLSAADMNESGFGGE